MTEETAPNGAEREQGDGSSSLLDRVRASAPFRLLTSVRDRLQKAAVRRRIHSLQNQALSASASFRPNHYLRAAEMAADADMHAEALSLYGLAIDGHLEAGRGRAAEVLCRKVLERYPHVVRARRTLALLAIGRGEPAEAANLVGEYASVARESGDDRLLRQSLRMIALIAEDEPVRDRAVAELRAIGDEKGADRVLSREYMPEDEPFDASVGPWSQTMQAALLGAERVRELPL